MPSLNVSKRRWSLTIYMLGNVSCLLTVFFFSFFIIFSAIKQLGSRSGLTERLGLIWVKTVHKDHQQTTKFAANRQRVKVLPVVIVKIISTG